MFNLGDESGKLFVKTSSLVDSSSFSIVDPTPGSVSVSLVSSVSKQGKSFGLSPSQVSDFWCQGAGDYKVHALVMTPPDFDKSRTYPLAMLIHGGPQGAWGESCKPLPVLVMAPMQHTFPTLEPDRKSVV